MHVHTKYYYPGGECKKNEKKELKTVIIRLSFEQDVDATLE